DKCHVFTGQQPLSPIVRRSWLKEFLDVGAPLKKPVGHRPMSQVRACASVIGYELSELRLSQDHVRLCCVLSEPCKHVELVVMEIIGCAVPTQFGEPPREQVEIGRRDKQHEQRKCRARCDPRHQRWTDSLVPAM